MPEQQLPTARSPRRAARLSVLALLIAMLVGVFVGAAASASAATSATEWAGVPSVRMADPQEAVVSVVMVSMSGLSMTAGTFDATFYLGIQCDWECDPADWEIVNATSLRSELVTEEPQGTWWRVTGRFVFQPDLRLFPFDTQQLPLVIEHRNLDSASLVFVPNVTGSEVAPDVSVPGWDLEPFSFESSTSTLRSLNASFSRLVFEVQVGRSPIASITKYYVPLIIFVMLGAATLVLARSDYQIRTGGTALVGLTIFYLATSGGVATVGYLTLWDLSVLIGYLALGMVLVCGVIGAYLFHEGAYEGPEGAARSKRMRFRFLYAIGAFVGLGAVGIGLIAAMT